MSENYKITRKVALRIVELRNDGLSFRAISEKVNSEFEIDINESSSRKFHKNFLNGKSRILPKAEMEMKIVKNSSTLKAKTDMPVNEKNVNYGSNKIDSGLAEIISDQGLSDGSEFNKAKQPSNDLLGLFQDKPRNR